MIEQLNIEEIEAECQAAFDTQEREKERKQDKKRQRQLTKIATQEVYQKKHMFKKGASRGGVDNIRYVSKVIEPLLIPFWKEITLQIYGLDK